MSGEKKDTLGLILVGGGVAFMIALWCASLIMGSSMHG